MKSLMSLLGLVLLLQAQPVMAKDLSPDADLGPTINMSEPPFWVSSYDEFNDFQDDQKELYVKKLLPKLSAIPALKEMTKSQLQEASEWHQGWNSMRVKIYHYCLDKSTQPVCDDIESVRGEVLDMYSHSGREGAEREPADEKEVPAPTKKKTTTK